jgi:hypothetical protein
MNSGASTLFHFLILKRYATANNPAIENITSNPGTPFSSDGGISATVVVGDGVIGVGVRGMGVTVGSPFIIAIPTKFIVIQGLKGSFVGISKR